MIPAGASRQLRFRAHVLLISVLIGTTLHADDESAFSQAADLLNQMSLAMSQMTYQGTFVYVQGSLVETMRITHVVDENGIHERLVAETGPQREILRDASGVRWIAKDSKSMVRDPAFKRSYFPEVNVAAIEMAADYYTIAIGGLEPMAGRQGRKLSIVPRDRYRYGYTLWLEDPSGLLLKWELFENSARPLARLMFTDLRFGREVDLAELQTSEPVEEYATHASDIPANQELTNALPRWAPTSLPPGFSLTAHRRQDKRTPEIFQHLIYSDGIAAVSVYVEPAVEGRDTFAGITRMGTTHAFSRRQGGLQITVVGDVPAITVQEIGEAVKQNAP